MAMTSREGRRRVGTTVLVLLVLSLVGACQATPADRPSQRTEEQEEGAMTLALKSTAFEAGGTIPVEYTCDGANISPPLSWEGVPAQTRSLALIMDDPDAPAGTWVHWLLYNIPPQVTELAEALSDARQLPGIGLQGHNSFKNSGYGGPCPPRGNPHRYFFRLYALDKVLDLEPGAERRELEAAMQGHILAQGEIMATYRRR